MKKEIKFTTEGKKVVVIGSLNSVEKIVQEIFIIDGSEIPSGEHFVVKSLHDAPAVSWKEKEMKDLEIRYEKKRKEYNDMIDDYNKRLRNEYQILRNKLQYAGSVIKNISPESFDTLVNYLTGEIKWIVKNCSYSPEIIEFKNFTENYEDKLRLVSIYGKDDGSLTYAIGQYYDFSGGNTNFTPFTSYESAFSHFKEQVLKCTVNEKIISISKKYEITLDAKGVEEYRRNTLKGLDNNIENYNAQIAKWNEAKNKINEA
jgi:hypothetical protein